MSGFVRDLRHGLSSMKGVEALTDQLGYFFVARLA
jgi:hypothetical protein